MTSKPESHAGTYAWGALGLGILAWDIFGDETLSSAGRRAMEHPLYRYLYMGAIGATALHLVDGFSQLGLPDPFKKALEPMRTSVP